MKIVKFKDGKFGVRKGILFFKFLDLTDTYFWLTSYSNVEQYCKGTLEQAKQALGKQRLTKVKFDKGKVYKDAINHLRR